MDTPHVLIVAGPTAAGKTALAVELALAWDAVVLSADAMQVYRGMDIGTAKVTPAEARGVPHYGLDRVAPDDAYDAGRFLTDAAEVLHAHPRVVVCGGTGMWLHALVHGLVATPPVDRAQRASLEGAPDLWDRLAAVDPVLAARLHPNDRVRLVRGLEVFLATGQPLSTLHAAHAGAPDRVRAAGVWVDRDDLDARIDSRVERMMDAGYLDEVSRLLDGGVSRMAKPMRSLGYRHLADHLLDGVPRDEAVRRTQRDTRRFARKQRNWSRQLGWPSGVDPRALGEQAAASIWGVRPSPAR